MSKRDRTRRGRKDASRRKRVAHLAHRQVNAIAEHLPSQRVRATQPPRARATTSRADSRSRVAAPSSDATTEMPEHLHRRFVAAGNIYYFPWGGRAFVDRGDRLTTRSEKREVIEGLAAIAHARGWRQITLTGTDRFKQQMWLAATLSGLAVRDYPPSSHLQAQLVRLLARQARDGSLPSQTLAAQTEANATAASRSQPPSPRRAPNRRGDESRPIHRHRFVIETPAFWAARGEIARMVRDPSVSAHAASRQHPDLAGTYLQLRAAQLAADRLSHPDDQRRFVALVRGGLAEAIARGEPLHSVRVRASTRESPAERAAAPLRG